MDVFFLGFVTLAVLALVLFGTVVAIISVAVAGSRSPVARVLRIVLVGKHPVLRAALVNAGATLLAWLPLLVLWRDSDVLLWPLFSPFLVFGPRTINVDQPSYALVVGVFTLYIAAATALVTKGGERTAATVPLVLFGTATLASMWMLMAGMAGA